ncbi:GntR family transcriptional regulator [Streptomyces sp. NBC_00243]|uniref:GntR family transcriptional regulator n=1 Tax=Streptomyces sp. NBC_00243 TaxID=2975688 RepID=UPI002DD938B1|nr:GntR family transcriptional regulator [Streptomyces sp. NBC_00243]WRZ25283.1 GntR family transcriptional regulator [Streptomyces sp. NBC_00243]
MAKLWNAAQVELAKNGSRLTLARASRESGVPVATLSDWRRGNHVPREAEELLKVVRLLCAWAKQDPPVESRWRRLIDDPGSSATADVSHVPFASSIVALGDRLTSAFSAPHVEIDALCLNGQSLAAAMGNPIHAIHAGVVRPAKISVRVLLPSRDIALAFPCAVDANDSEDLVHQTWLGQRNAHAQSMTAMLRSLRSTHGIDVEVTYRALPITPMAKMYLINGTEALFSYYTIVRREAEINQRPMEVYDASAMGLVRLFGAGENGPDTAFVEQSQLWFNSMWETVSTEMVYTY